MNRGRATDSPNTSRIVRSFTIGSVGIGLAHDLPESRRQSASSAQVGAHDDVHVGGHEDTIADPRKLFVEEIQLGADRLSRVRPASRP